MNASEIRTLVNSLLDSWNRRDWRAFASCFSEEGTYVTGEGTRWSGRRNIQLGMQRLLAAGGTGGTAAINSLTIRRLAPGAAVVDLAWRLVDEEPSKDPPSLPREGLTLPVVTLLHGSWQIAAAQNTDIAGSAASSPPRSQP